jgi:hypothetical protein
MRLETKTIAAWPKLAWAAFFAEDATTIRVCHGPMVEVAGDWLVEGVWAGDFEKGDFDRTDLVFGTGIRCREDSATFVSSGSVLDRLVYCETPIGWRVSNSLGALLACSGLDLRDDYDYSADLLSICGGLQNYVRSVPASASRIGLVYVDNLEWDGRSLREIAKPDSCPVLSDFRSYERFLHQTARSMAENAQSPRRAFPVEMLATLSSGYDSSATAAIVRQAGCRNAVTICRSTSYWRGADSGKNIARILGLDCKAVPRSSAYYRLEPTIWAVGGRPGVLNWTLFDYPEPLCCLFTGCHGDKMWERDDKESPDPFAIPSIALLGMGEFRLVKGVFHCPLPHWGMRHLAEIRRISFAKEMKPWVLGRKSYDRPIARRIVEEAGVPRNAFALRKKNTSHESEFLWPYSPRAKDRFGKYLRDRGCYVPGTVALWLFRRLAHAENMLHANLFRKIGLHGRLQPWGRIAGRLLTFQWANSELKKMYEEGLALGEPGSGFLSAQHNDRTESAVIPPSGPSQRTVGRGNRVGDALIVKERPADGLRPVDGTKHGGMFRLSRTIVPAWPKLAWVASTANGSSEIQVLCGPLVEKGDDWIAEAVWDGDFEKGDFDRTDLVFGTGIRVRDGAAVFVSSGTTFDRLLYCNRGNSWYFSNSLPALLAAAGLRLRNDYLQYAQDSQSIVYGLENRVRTIPTASEDVTSIFFNNLVFDGQRVIEQEKPDAAPPFASFRDYHDYLVAASTRIGANLASSQRRNSVVPLSSISSGYDSCVAAAISRIAGCRQTVSIKNSTSFWRGSDSGAEVAKHLGMSCAEYPRTASSYPMETSIWAASGRPGILNWTLFDYPSPLCLFFTGCHGEKMWDRVDHDHPDPFVRRDSSSLGFCEYRLIKGIFQCPLPFWAIRHSRELKAITLSEEMRPWYTGRDYDKPIARRILGQAGVPGELFGTVKRNSSHEAAFLWPYSRDAGEKFAAYLRERGLYAPRPPMLSLVRRVDRVESLLHANILGPLGLSRRLRPWERLAGSRLIFQWANDELEKRYVEGLREMKALVPSLTGAAARVYSKQVAEGERLGECPAHARKQ